MGMFDKWTAEELAKTPNNQVSALSVPEPKTVQVGATVTHVFTYPFAYVEGMTLSVVYVQEPDKILTKTLSFVSSDTDAGTFTAQCILTPEETSLFSADLRDAEIQVKCESTDGTYYSRVEKAIVLRKLEQTV